MNLTTYGKRQFRKVLTGEVTPPTSLFLVLFKADPTVAGSLANEVTAGDDDQYVRDEITGDVSGTGWTDPDTQDPIANQALLTAVAAAEAGANYVVTHVGLADSATLGAGNLWMYKALSQSKTMTGGDAFTVASGALSFGAS